MTILKHELRQGRSSFLIWTSVIGVMLSVCVFLYTEVRGEMDAVTDLFSSFGSFTAAFGMDRLNFGTLEGFYAIECGSMLGLGGAFFAAICAVNMLSKEEVNKTADFLFSHPVSRKRVLLEKLLAVFVQLTMMNVIVLAMSLLSILAIGETIPWAQLLLLHLAYYLLQLELAGICYGISAFVKRGSVGIGLGIAVLFYFTNLISNLTESASFLKYFTPFAYCDGADIITEQRLDGGLMAIGAGACLLGILIAWYQYTRKDLS
ncbi:MAG: ABC transporter permease subunit [Oscillospiraceae bacterium]|nr:ABC transporter permease subunit [Oscillospiraceae bacterium]